MIMMNIIGWSMFILAVIVFYKVFNDLRKNDIDT